MGRSLDSDQSEEPNEDFGQAGSACAVYAEQNPARLRRAYREILDSLADRRKRLLEQDALGRTPLFYAAEKGLEEEVWNIIFRFRGTGLCPPRLALIAIKDHSGLTAADVAEQNGHSEIAHLLRKEQARMEYHE
jgi:ankyrin repeat protein